MAAARRCSVDLTEPQVLECVALLPLSARSKSVFVPYSDTNFKHVPKWEEAKHYVPCLSRILQHTGGWGANQVAFVAGSKNWAAELSISEAPLEAGIYRLRAILSQLGNKYEIEVEKQIPTEACAEMVRPPLGNDDWRT